ncbi:MAG: guanylate kinase [Actinobacteria bacterium]|nr:guanylate kinase [Actinomycetota bacterium]
MNSNLNTLTGVRHGNLFVISGPSGAGKGTLVARMTETFDDVWRSISATTRPPREGENNGVHYYFLSDEEFSDLIAQDGLLEWATVHGKRYGTPRTAIEEKIASGKQVILEIDPQGAFQVREKFPEAILIFIDPPSLEELEKRLIHRGTEDAQQIRARLDAAKVELSQINEYDIVVKNDDLDLASKQLADIIDFYAIS